MKWEMWGGGLIDTLCSDSSTLNVTANRRWEYVACFAAQT